MTKTKAFLICFIVPTVVFLLPAPVEYCVDAISFNSAFVDGLAQYFFWIFLFPISLLAIPFFVRKKWGIEFRKYGAYGSVVSLFGVTLYVSIALMLMWGNLIKS